VIPLAARRDRAVGHLSYRGESFTNFAASQGSYSRIPSSNTVNATAVYKTGPYEFGLFGTNLTNGAKISDVTTNTIAIQPGDNLYMIRPRTVGGASRRASDVPVADNTACSIGAAVVGLAWAASGDAIVIGSKIDTEARCCALWWD
jgi:hypothetical protein